MSKKEKIKKIILFMIMLYVIFPSVIIVGVLLDSCNLTPYDIDLFFSPQLSEETVLSLSDNLSKISNGYVSSFNDKNFEIKQYSGEGQLYGKYVATIRKKPFYKRPITPEPNKVYVNFDAVFYYDTISKCDKYYEVSYNPVTQKALCIYSDYSFKIRNPFSAKVIKKYN